MKIVDDLAMLPAVPLYWSGVHQTEGIRGTNCKVMTDNNINTMNTALGSYTRPQIEDYLMF